MYCVLYLVLSQKYLMDLLWYHTNADNFVGKCLVFCLKNPQSICWKGPQFYVKAAQWKFLATNL